MAPEQRHRRPQPPGWTTLLGPGAQAGWPRLLRLNQVVDGVATRCRTYATTDQVNDAVGVIAAARAQDRPYFAWVAFNAPHRPYHKPPNGLHSLDGLPDRGGPDRSYLEAMVEALDTEIGRLLREVDLATTTVIFLGDNGTQDSSIAPPYSPPRQRGPSTTPACGCRWSSPARPSGGRGARSPPWSTPSTSCRQFWSWPASNRRRPAGRIGTDGMSLMPYLRNRSHPSPRASAFAERLATG